LPPREAHQTHDDQRQFQHDDGKPGEVHARASS
jgi:hypothetical protein